MKYYMLLALFLARRKDRDATTDDIGIVEDALGKKVRNEAGKIDLGLVKNLAPLVGHCQITRAKKKRFLDIALTREEGMEVNKILDKALGRKGKRQWDPAVAKPIHKYIKLGLEKARGRGSRV